MCRRGAKECILQRPLPPNRQTAVVKHLVFDMDQPHFTFMPGMHDFEALLQAEPAHKEAVRGIAFSPSDLKFATCSDDSTIKASTDSASNITHVQQGCCALYQASQNLSADVP